MIHLHLRVLQGIAGCGRESVFDPAGTAANLVFRPSLDIALANQERIEWPRNLVVAKAYIDQLERSQGLPSDRIAALRQAIQNAEGSKKELKKLKSFAASLEKDADSTSNASDSARLKDLAEILKRPKV